MSITCDLCDKRAGKLMIGCAYNKTIKRSRSFYGNAFCSACLEHVKDQVGQYRPAPGYSKPPNFIVVQQRYDTITGEQAITYAIACGNWIRACEIRDKVLAGKRVQTKSLQSSIERPLDSQLEEPIISAPIAYATLIPDKLPLPDQFIHIQRSNPFIPELKKSECPYCHKLYAMTVDGFIRQHRCITSSSV